MREAIIDILASSTLATADAICFTSNGVVSPFGNLVMGAGVAKQFAQRYPSLPKYFGQCVTKGGNHVYFTPSELDDALIIISFPTKNDWRDLSDINLIRQSCRELMVLANQLKLSNIYLPRPGVGYGGLNWDRTVKPAISKLLDNRVTVVYR